MYVPTAAQTKSNRERFTYHPPKGDQAERYGRIREAFLGLAGLLVTSCPESRELSTSLTLLQQASMMANAAIACNE